MATYRLRGGVTNSKRLWQRQCQERCRFDRHDPRLVQLWIIGGRDDRPLDHDNKHSRYQQDTRGGMSVLELDLKIVFGCIARRRKE